jgi:hypothetical protein
LHIKSACVCKIVQSIWQFPTLPEAPAAAACAGLLDSCRPLLAASDARWLNTGSISSMRILSGRAWLAVRGWPGVGGPSDSCSPDKTLMTIHKLLAQPLHSALPAANAAGVAGRRKRISGSDVLSYMSGLKSPACAIWRHQAGRLDHRQLAVAQLVSA